MEQFFQSATFHESSCGQPFLNGYAISKKSSCNHKLNFYFKVALAALQLSGTIIISGGHLQWSSIFKGIVFLLNKHLQSSLFS